MGIAPSQDDDYLIAFARALQTERNSRIATEKQIISLLEEIITRQTFDLPASQSVDVKLKIPMRVDTMTLNETAQLFRNSGISTSETTLADGIEQGAYPFGVCIKNKTGHRIFQIYRRLVQEWLERRAIPE